MDLRAAIGLGVAGNFAGHLEQAGESADFVGLDLEDPQAPKGIFPFYVPGDPGFLGVFPVDSGVIARPPTGGDLQIEPETALLCDIRYEGERVAELTPTAFAAWNDCSIRRPGARKISEKTNWGPQSKGASATWLPLDRFAAGGVLDTYRLGCWLRRDGELHEYGVDSPVSGYTYVYERLLAWLADRMAHQQDRGPLEDIPALIARARRPSTAVVSIGATRYTPYGESTFLQPGDEVLVLLYDASMHESPHALLDGDGLPPGVSRLRQRVL